MFGDTPTYEYKVLPLTTTSCTERELNEQGRHGWLLVTSLPHLIFARPVSRCATALGEASKEPMVLTVKQVCERLNLSRSKVYELLAAGRLHAIKVGRMTRIPRQELERFIVSAETR